MTRSSPFQPGLFATGIAAAIGLAASLGVMGSPSQAPVPRPLPAALADAPGVPVVGADSAFPTVQLAGPIPARILHIVDGDTVEARVQVWLSQDVVTRVRLRGIDAPEINGACARERDQAIAARERLAALLARQPVWLADIGRDKYFGRVVARLIDGDGADFGERLMREGFARAYDGGRRTGWCR